MQEKTKSVRRTTKLWLRPEKAFGGLATEQAVAPPKSAWSVPCFRPRSDQTYPAITVSQKKVI